LTTDPDWNTPSRLNGLPATNWKRRSGVTMDGTFAECLERWLGLPHHHQINCSLSVEGTGEPWEPERMAAFVRRSGLPPALASRVQGNAEVLMRMLEGAKTEQPVQHFPDGAPIARGYGRG
jgi:hypothetical protein